MLKRKILNDLIAWKNNKRNTCLMVIGARQVGKTFIIREFAKENYDSFYEINFFKNNTYKEIFNGDLSSENILTLLSLKLENFNLIEGKTLIFLDEIQDCPNALTALKFLAEDKRFDVIASGSMLGLTYKRTSSYPVGYVEELNMYSLDFEEYLWAKGIKQEVINYVKEFYDNKKTVDVSIHNRMLELFKEYIVVGGMPAVVNEFINTKNFALALNQQKNILNGYKKDILKYSDDDEKTRIRACFDSIPSQLAKDNKKFKYSLIEKKASSDKYRSSLQWLYDAGIINFCYNLSNPETPLEGNKINDCFKVYLNDTGLLIAMLDDGTNDQIMSGNLGIYKGAIYENIIAEVFTKLGKNLYYFEKNSTLEIDFFIRYNNQVTAVEVKSADNTKSKSLNSVMNNYGVINGIKLSSKNLGISDKNNVISLPIYMSIFL